MITLNCDVLWNDIVWKVSKISTHNSEKIIFITNPNKTGLAINFDKTTVVAKETHPHLYI